MGISLKEVNHNKLEYANCLALLWCVFGLIIRMLGLWYVFGLA